MSSFYQIPGGPLFERVPQFEPIWYVEWILPISCYCSLPAVNPPGTELRMCCWARIQQLKYRTCPVMEISTLSAETVSPILKYTFSTRDVIDFVSKLCRYLNRHYLSSYYRDSGPCRLLCWSLDLRLKTIKQICFFLIYIKMYNQTNVIS